MRKNSNAILASVFLIGSLLSGCSKDKNVEEILSAGGDKNEAKTSVVTTWYVSANFGKDDGSFDGKTTSTPFKTLQKASNVTNPGDVVLIMNGTYTNNGGSPALNITRSGSSSAYITYKVYPGSTPIIKASGNVYNLIRINASYIKFENLELMGDNANLTLSGAEAAYNAYYNGGAKNGPQTGTYNTNGITIGGANGESLQPHHVEVRACTVHDFPGGGINAQEADYVTIEANTVYNNAWYTMWGASGISIIYPINSPGSVANIARNKIQRNKAYNNKTLVKWVSINNYSDGNGIISDINQASGSYPAFTGRTLVENNISYLNGGSGVKIMSDKTDVYNNSLYKNGQFAATNYSNLSVIYCNDVKVRYNIMYAKWGGKCNATTGSTSVTWDYNVFQYLTTTVDGGGSVIATNGTNYKIADPKFSNPDAGDLWLQPTSQAINMGNAGPYPSVDHFYNARPKNGSVDAGAYEVN